MPSSWPHWHQHQGIATFSGSLPTASGGHPSARLSRRPTIVTSPHLRDALGKIYTSLLEPGKKYLTLAQFQKFLSDVQKTSFGEGFEVWAKETFKHSPKGVLERLLGDEGSFTFEDFCAYMTSPRASALAVVDPRKKDMTKPLSEYFISTSHNTYLVGNQLYGASTTQGYINVLQRGCRCIEIDVWDGNDGEPQVYHGWTLTKEISFQEVCEAIKEHAFFGGELGGEEAVDGPVIISLECHASPEQQGKMVKIMKRVWGNMLVDKPIMGERDCHNVLSLPSPDQLKGKILVKAKYLPPDQPAVESALFREHEKAADSSSSSPSSEGELSAHVLSLSKRKPLKVKVIRSLSDLGIYCSSRKFTSFVDAAARAPTHIFSFSEKTFKSHYDADQQAVLDHNLCHMMRIYPFGLRIASSNCDPSYFWRKGAQLVALNWQKCDSATMLNEGLFAGEGGYVLKPPELRPSAGVVKQKTKNLDLEVEVIACQGLPLPSGDDKSHKFNPYVKIEIHVQSASDEAEKFKGRTRKATNQGIDATWEPKKEMFASSKKTKTIGEVVKFKNVAGVITDGMLSFIRFKIRDEEFGKDDLAAWACIRLDRLQQGYRIIDLFDSRGNISGGVLLCKISWSMYE